ncbi:MAG: tetratricopeptide repeat protein [Planctomycetota bacterium]|nr:MAG: tetratricopeptide repeat protein [Planctomycetota bacterium]
MRSLIPPRAATRPLALVCALVLAPLAGCATPCVGVLKPAAKQVVRYNNTGGAALKAGKIDEAIRNFELALKLEPLYIQALANLGYAYYLKGQYDNAVIRLRLAIENCPDYADSYNYLGLVYWHGFNDPAKAEEQFRTAIDTYPTFAEAMYNLGELYYSQSRKAEALEWYKRAARTDPSFAKANVKAGLIYLQNGYSKEAEQHFQLALDQDPDLALALYGLGRLRLKKEQWVEGIDLLRRARKADPSFRPAKTLLDWAVRKAPERIAKRYIERAHAELDKGDKGDLDRALEDLAIARRIDPDSIDVLVLAARVLLEQGRVKDAQRQLRKAYAKDPRNRDVRFLSAVIFLRNKEYAKAVAVLRKLCREAPRSLKFHNYLAVAYFYRKEYRKAERHWKIALDLEGSEAQKKQVRDNLAKLAKIPHIRRANELVEQGDRLRARGDLEGAMTFYRQAATLDDPFALAHARIAEVALEQGDLATARRKAEDALKRDGDLPFAHIVMGRVLLRERRLREAKKRFDEAAELAPYLGDPLYYLAVVAEQSQRPDIARKLLEKAIVTDPRHVPAFVLLARLHRREGNYTQAENYLNLAATAAEKDDPRVFTELGRLYLAMDKTEDAQQAFELAHQLAPEQPAPWEGFAEARERQGDTVAAAGAYAQAAAAYLARHDPDTAAVMARRAVRLAPEAAEPLRQLGLALEAQGKPTEALATLRQATEKEGGENLLAWFSLGEFYERRGERAQAAEAFEHVIRLNPKNYFALEKLASLYREGAERPVSRRQAIEYLRQALQLDPRPEAQAQIRAALRSLEGGGS